MKLASVMGVFFVVLACSSSSTTTGTSTGGSGGTGAPPVGGGGVGGDPDAASGGTGGTLPTGGTAGATGGTSGSTGGVAGSGAVAGGGASGADAGPAPSVLCPPNECPLPNGQCCHEPGKTTSCQNAGVSCPKPAFLIECDEASDCGVGEVCCLTYTLATSTTKVACTPMKNCVDNCPSTLCSQTATQLCDPKLVPTECVKPSPSTCKAYTGTTLPSGYYTCQ